MNRWVPDDRRYDQPETLRERFSRPAFRWASLFLAWVLVTGLLSALHLTLLIWPLMVALIWYAVVVIFRTTPSMRRRGSRKPERIRQGQAIFNPAPGWPEPPPGWSPPPNWEPDPAWPPAPPGWQFWEPAPRHATSERRWQDLRQDRDRWR